MRLGCPAGLLCCSWRWWRFWWWVVGGGSGGRPCAGAVVVAAYGYQGVGGGEARFLTPRGMWVLSCRAGFSEGAWQATAVCLTWPRAGRQGTCTSDLYTLALLTCMQVVTVETDHRHRAVMGILA